MIIKAVFNQTDLLKGLDAILVEDTLPHESRLRTKLLEDYNPSVRPAVNTSTPTKVVVDLVLQQIIDVVSVLETPSLLCFAAVPYFFDFKHFLSRMRNFRRYEQRSG